MHTFGEKSSFFNLTDGYAGRFIGWLPFAEALQHPLKAVYRFLRRCDLHLPAGGEYPAVEIAAEINGRLHSEVVLVHNLRGCILPEAVDDCKKVPTPVKEIAKDRLFYRCANTMQ